MGKSVRRSTIMGIQKQRSEKRVKRNLHGRFRVLGRARLADALRNEDQADGAIDLRELRHKELMPKAGKHFISGTAMSAQASAAARGNPHDAKARERCLHKLVAK